MKLVYLVTGILSLGVVAGLIMLVTGSSAETHRDDKDEAKRVVAAYIDRSVRGDFDGVQELCDRDAAGI